MERKRRMFAFTAPSGAGKTTVVRHLLSNYEFLDFSISATTRAKREHEVDGRDYYFLSPDDFKRKIEEEAFIEWEEVYADQFYGTLHSEVERVWEKGKNIIFDIDVKGAASLKKAYGGDCFVTFISPPSLEVLIDRLKGRNTESLASLKKRIDRVTREMTYQNTFDTVLFNDVLEVTFHDARAIVENFIFEKDSLKA